LVAQSRGRIGREVAKPFERIVARVRGAFSSVVLGTTSAAPPALSGGLSLRTRATVTIVAVATSAALAFAFYPLAGPPAVLLLFPAMMVAGMFGGMMLTAIAFVFAIWLSATFFIRTENGFVLFTAATALQSILALVLRELFRESRRWGVRYRTLIDSVSSAVIVSDPLGQIEMRQPEFERITGMAWPDYAGMGWLKAVHPDDLQIGQSKPAVKNSVLRRTVRLRNAAGDDWHWYQFRSVAVPGREGRPAELISVLFDIHSQKLAQEERDIQAGEIRHRWKNLMTVITSLASSSQPEGDAGVESYVKKLLGRLHALSAAGDHAIVGNRAIDIGGVVHATLAPFIEEHMPRIAIEGPPCLVSEATGGSLALGMHELATNAIKYGALSAPEGSVDIRWGVTVAESRDTVMIIWTETGGPPAHRPNKESFGTRVIRFIPARERNGRVDLDYRPEGLVCTISFVRDRIDAALAAE
jgi:PAS domain S-box-containing protein